MRLLARGLHVHDAAVGRIVADHADDFAVHARERGDHGTAEAGLNLEHRFAIDDKADQLAHVIRLARRTRNDAGQRIFAAIYGISGVHHRRQLPHILRHVGEKTPDLCKAIRLVLGHIVNGAGGVRRDLCAAQFFLGYFFAEGAFDHRRPCRENLAGAPYHDRPMREYRARRRPAGRGAHHRAHHRNNFHQIDRALETILPVARHHRVPFAPRGIDRTAGAVAQIDQRNAVLISEVFDEAALSALAPVAAEAGAGAQGVILAADGHRAAIEVAEAHDVRRGFECFEFAFGIVTGAPRERADFAERTRIQQAGDALAHRELAGGVMFRHRVRAAATFGQRAAPMYVVDFRLPGHGGAFTAAQPECGRSALKYRDDLSFSYRVFFLDENFFYHAAVFGDHRNFHFHRFDHDQRIARFHRVANAGFDLPHGAGDFGFYFDACHAFPVDCS